MIIKSIRLKNIRSYKDARINFKKGITLLEGDIGSGKSSILYALDFALFGLKKFDSVKLLRHGETSAKVELELEIDNKSVLISRSLEKTRTSISQKNTTISINNSMKALSPTMLDYEIKSLLGFNINTKEDYSPFYYTVYTAQETMKDILNSKKDDRLKLIRDIFQIDKYQKIKSNSLVFSKYLYSRINYLRGRTQGIDELIEQINQKNKELSQLESKLKELSASVEIKKQELDKLSDSIKIKKEYDLKRQKIEKDISRIEATLKTNKLNIDSISMKIKKLTMELLKYSQKDLDKELSQKNKDLKELSKELEKLRCLRKEYLEINNKITENATRIKDFESTINKINKLDTCPLCLQDVSHEHKNHIKEEQTKKINNFQKIKEIFIKKRQELELQISLLESKQKHKENLLKEIYSIEKERSHLKNLRKTIDDLENDKQKILDTEINLRKSLALKKQELSQIFKNLDEFSNIDEDYNKIYKQYHEIKTELSVITNNMNMIKKEIHDRNKELEQKNKDLKELEYLSNIHSWINNVFINLLSTIEKHVLARIYNEFNVLFKNWFSILIDDDNIQASIDESFSPVITQNNYDIDYKFLSGGEKTAVALAYRLAINKAVNGLSESIRTKDLLILDEPTEGFSTEQLDRVRDVLLSLNLSQIILVSHEQKMQTIADHTIKLIKINGTTKIVGDNNF